MGKWKRVSRNWNASKMGAYIDHYLREFEDDAPRQMPLKEVARPRSFEHHADLDLELPDKFLVPEGASNSHNFNPEHFDQTGAIGDPPPPDTVIVGVIDRGIPLSHRRLQFKDGTTRILAAWQQQGTPLKARKNSYLPFGVEVYADKINKTLDACRPAGPMGPLDEDCFNRALGLVNMRDPRGARDLARRSSHGAHTLDTVAGFAPSTDPEILQKIRVIVVNLPSRAHVGQSGAFLDTYALLGMQRILSTARALWAKGHAQDPDSFPSDRSYRVLINLSFGKNAGSRDGTSRFKRLIESYAEKHKFDLVMPVGNDNLRQGVGRARLPPKEESSVQHEARWRILPEDRSPNFLEIWVASNEKSAGPKFKIEVLPPGGRHSGRIPPCNGALYEAPDGIARLFVQRRGKRIGITLAVRETYCSSGRTSAPAGLWRVRLHSTDDRPIRARFSVQTDQSAEPDTATGLRSYLEDAKYAEFAPSGMPVDSYSFSPAKPAIDTDNGELVSRHGTMNALATSSRVATIAGFRVSDGCPAPYSSTGARTPRNIDPQVNETTEEHKRRERSIRRQPTAALPSDDGPSHKGRLAAGAVSGSVVARQGTSYASALATRTAALVILGKMDFDWDQRKIKNQPKMRHRSASAILGVLARWADRKKGPAAHPNTVASPKVGAGRLIGPDLGYCPRT